MGAQTNIWCKFKENWISRSLRSFQYLRRLKEVREKRGSFLPRSLEEKHSDRGKLSRLTETNIGPTGRSVSHDTVSTRPHSWVMSPFTLKYTDVGSHLQLNYCNLNINSWNSTPLWRTEQNTHGGDVCFLSSGGFCLFNWAWKEATPTKEKQAYF